MKRKIDFQDGSHGCNLGFLIGTILATFDLQVTQMLPPKFRVNWPFGSGEEAKNRFSRWPLPLPSWISDRNDFSYMDAWISDIVDLQVTLILPRPFCSSSK